MKYYNGTVEHCGGIVDHCDERVNNCYGTVNHCNERWITVWDSGLLLLENK